MKTTHRMIRSIGTSLVALFLIAGASFATTTFVGGARHTDTVPAAQNQEDASDALETEDPSETADDETAEPAETAEVETEDPSETADAQGEDPSAGAKATKTKHHKVHAANDVQDNSGPGKNDETNGDNNDQGENEDANDDNGANDDDQGENEDASDDHGGDSGHDGSGDDDGGSDHGGSGGD